MGSPSLIDAQGNAVLKRLNALTTAAQNKIEQGGVITDGGTTQASGANTAPNFDADVDLTFASVAGENEQLAAAADVDADAGDAIVWGATSDRAAYMALVLSTGVDKATPEYIGVAGSVLDTTAVTPAPGTHAPTEAEIDTALGHSNWVLLGDVLLSRTADTTITFAADYTRRSGGIRGKTGEDVNFSNALAETEEEWKNFGGAILP